MKISLKILIAITLLFSYGIWNQPVEAQEQDYSKMQLQLIQDDKGELLEQLEQQFNVVNTDVVYNLITITIRAEVDNLAEAKRLSRKVRANTPALRYSRGLLLIQGASTGEVFPGGYL